MGAGPAGGRGGRIAWAGPHDDWLLVSGFDRLVFISVFYDSNKAIKYKIYKQPKFQVIWLCFQTIIGICAVL